MIISSTLRSRQKVPVQQDNLLCFYGLQKNVDVKGKAEVSIRSPKMANRTPFVEKTV